MTLAKARIINYDSNSSFIVLATVITIVNYYSKTFIVQATGSIKIKKTKGFSTKVSFLHSGFLIGKTKWPQRKSTSLNNKFLHRDHPNCIER